MAEPDPELVKVQESNSEPSNEVIMSNFSLQGETEFHLNAEDQNLLVAIRKGTSKCTKRPFIPSCTFPIF